MCRRSVQDIREHEGDIEYVQETRAGDQGTCRRDKEMCKRHVQDIREYEGEMRTRARDTCRTSGNMKER
jgi:hypothetical protein